jgi:hypothetical protein
MTTTKRVTTSTEPASLNGARTEAAARAHVATSRVDRGPTMALARNGAMTSEPANVTWGPRAMSPATRTRITPRATSVQR